MAALANHQHSEKLTDLDLSGTAPTIAPVATNVVPLKVPVPAAAAVPASDLEAFYGSIGKAEAEELQAVAARIKERDRAARAAIIDIGNDLITIKEGMTGHFDRWLKLEFDMSKATAWNYINAAEQFGSAPKVVETLPPGTVYKLAAKATPADLRKTIVLEIESGAVLKKNEVEARITDARQKAAEAESARKQAEQEKAEAERQKQADDAAWQARAKELADDGKTEAEIAKVQKKWVSPSAKRQRVKDARDKAQQKRDDEMTKWREDRKAEEEKMQQDAERVANWLLGVLGPDNFETLRSELKNVRYSIVRAVEHMDPDNIAAAKAAAEQAELESAAIVEADRAAAEAAITEAGNASVEFGAF